MKKLPSPSMSCLDSYNICVQSISNISERTRYEACCQYFVRAAMRYHFLASRGKLFVIRPLTSDEENPVIIGSLTSRELINLYSYYMVSHPSKKARNLIYDVLLASSPKCPICGDIGQSTTLDHYLPKAFFPIFSVLPVNLIPSCKDCNLGKGASFTQEKEKQILHPYFDESDFFEEKWVFATINNNRELVFFVKAPHNWPTHKIERAKNHFKDFKLAKRYSIEASSELANAIDMRRSFLRNVSSEDFRNYLLSQANTNTYFINHWKRVLYQCLADNDWFCSHPH